jgi:hypothetical protein
VWAHLIVVFAPVFDLHAGMGNVAPPELSFNTALFWGGRSWKQWKNRRTRVGHLVKLGIGKETAVKTGCARKGAWRMSQVKWVMIALPKSYFETRALVIPWT